ncbi:neuronal acetylcholine receptor subunit alpha-7 isoform X1 [Anastrepha ludens]|uniref:neuronal acetylcholine receptor subunit alpha-7 isoform X1 n=2 Tax=Anastrepha ludens TaxID=28586 RepID=UPI0023AEDBCA|nr:neuronal acetylcholine receptor subunit alpha-7 isoform X1 [Anastrepha ludens]
MNFVIIKILTSGKRLQFAYPPFTMSWSLLLGISLFLLHSANSQEAYINGTKAWNITNLDRLRLQLTINYDKNSHPTYHGVPTNITLGMSVNYIDIDEINGKMVLHAWLRINWMDENRSWNAGDYDNITQIHMKPKEVWKPDIKLFNSAGEKSDYLGDTQILLAHDGSFLWVPPVVYTAYCSLNFRTWPYDTQTCKVKVGSLALTYIDSRYLHLKESLDYNELVQSTEWEIIGGDTAYRKQDYYNYIEFTFKLQRRSSMYAAVIFTPASCIILLALSSFWLPPQMGEKVMLNGVVIILIAAFLMYFAQLLPILADNTPLVVLFYSCSLLLLSISTIIAVCVLYLSTAKHKRHLPDLLRAMLNGPLSKVLFLENFTLEADPRVTMNNGTKELVEHQYENPDSVTDAAGINAATSSSSNRFVQFEWILMATAIDRIAFLCYSLTFIILAILYGI